MDQGDLVLRSMGFNLRSENRQKSAKFYSQNKSVILLREWDSPSMTMLGIGVLCDLKAMGNLETQHDPVINSPVMKSGGLRISLLDQNTQLHRWRDQGFEIVNPDIQINIGSHIESFSGILIQGSKSSVENLSKLGFTFIREGKWSATAVSSNKQFSLILSKMSTPTTVIAESSAIFDTVTKLGMAGHYGNKTPAPQNKQHSRVQKYNCVQFGNESSYSVEKFYPNLMLGNNLIIRERVQYLHISESTLEAHLSTL
jgi:hypothetical protein